MEPPRSLRSLPPEGARPGSGAAQRPAGPGSTSSPVLAIDRLDVYYGRAHVLQGVSLALERGVLAIVGRNGMGKTTLCNAITGLVPASGSVKLLGSEILGLAPHRITRRGIAYVPQGRRVWPSLTVDETLRLVARKKREIERIYAMFPRLAERKGHGGAQLSGGEQQMLAIGRALMNRPTLLLLDEPSLGLSPILVKEIFTIIKRVNEEQGMSILLVEQNAKVALETAHYGYVLEIGRVVMNDTCERLMHSKDIQEFYLGAKEEGARGERRWKKKKTWR